MHFIIRKISSDLPMLQDDLSCIVQEKLEQYLAFASISFQEVNWRERWNKIKSQILVWWLQLTGLKKKKE